MIAITLTGGQVIFLIMLVFTTQFVGGVLARMIEWHFRNRKIIKQFHKMGYEEVREGDDTRFPFTSRVEAKWTTGDSDEH